MKEQILKTISVISISALTIIGISYAQAWTGPTATAPNGNTPAPINVGSSSQTKGGGLSLGSLIVSGGAQFTSGAGTGKVLTSDSVGNASWQNVNGCVYTNIVNATRNTNYSIQLANGSGQNVCDGDYGCRYTVWRKLSSDGFTGWRYYQTGDLVYIQRPGGLSWYDSGGQSGNNGDSENTMLINTAGSGAIYDDYDTPVNAENRKNWIFRFTTGGNVDLRVAVCPV